MFNQQPINKYFDNYIFYDIYENIVVIKYSESGFFSQSTILLCGIIDHFNYFNKLPNIIDCSKLLRWYKTDYETNIILSYFNFPTSLDINNKESFIFLNNLLKNDFSSQATKNDSSSTLLPEEDQRAIVLRDLPERSVEEDSFFVACEEKINHIFFHIYTQHTNYQNIEYNFIIPIIKFYFYPSLQITNIIKDITSKYSVDYENTCVLFYRGNDKIIETPLSGYNEYIQFSQKIYKKNPNIKFLIQSDETEFIDFFTNIYPKNSFYFKDEIRHMNKQLSTVDKVFKDKNSLYSKYYLAITIIMSKCKYIVCGSGNCSIWIMLYRGNCSNVCQYLNGEWISNLLI